MENMERKGHITGWGVIGTLGTALAVGVGIGAHFLERQRVAQNEAYIDRQINASCAR